jgi:hypothetical protein
METKHYKLVRSEWAAQEDKYTLEAYYQGSITAPTARHRVEKNNGMQFESLAAFETWAESLGYDRL